jgi:hypothetical protein
VTDPANQAILSAETWNRFADNAFLFALKQNVVSAYSHHFVRALEFLAANP